MSFGTSVRKQYVIHFVLLLLFSLAAYSNSFLNSFNFDDVNAIERNPLFTDPSKFDLSYFLKRWRAVGDLSFALNHSLHGMDVRGYHILNFLIHLLNGWLVYLFVLLLFRTPWIAGAKGLAEEEKDISRLGRRVAFFSALLFLVHPVQTQAVTYIVQRYTSLATLFYLATIVLYLAARERKFLLFPFSIFTAVLAVKTKQIAFTLPMVILLAEFTFFPGKVFRRAAAVGAICVPVLAGLLVALRGPAWFSGDIFGKLLSLSKESPLISRYEYLCTQFRVMVTYLRLLLFPVNQRLDYDYPLYRSFFAPPVFLSFLLLVALAGAAFYLYIRSRKLMIQSRSSDAFLLRLGFFGILWFFFTHAVESGIIPISDLIVEHRLYLPSIGAFIAGTSLLVYFAELKGPVAVGAIGKALFVVAMVLSAATYQRNRVWANEATLWEDTAAKSPNLPRPLNNLARVYINRNDPLKGISLLIRANELAPGYTDTWRNIAIALDRMGVYGDRFRYGEELLDGGGRVKPRHLTEWFALSSNNLGLAYDATGEHRTAILQYEKALRLAPDLPEAHCNLGLALLAVGEEARAVEELRRVAVLNPQLARKMSLWFHGRVKAKNE